MISLGDANAIRTGATVTFDPDNTFPLISSVTSTSSRGPMFEDFRIKPEIGAPGASVSAMSGTGTQSDAFGGTSGAAPMVTGSAALLKQLYPTVAPPAFETTAHQQRGKRYRSARQSIGRDSGFAGADHSHRWR